MLFLKNTDKFYKCPSQWFLKHYDASPPLQNIIISFRDAPEAEIWVARVCCEKYLMQQMQKQHDIIAYFRSYQINNMTLQHIRYHSAYSSRLLITLSSALVMLLASCVMTHECSLLEKTYTYLSSSLCCYNKLESNLLQVNIRKSLWASCPMNMQICLLLCLHHYCILY